jgi:hypothetical protein
MIAETYLIEILIPGTNKWLDAGMNSRWKTLEEAQKEYDSYIKVYNQTYKFRINHIVCTETIIQESNGEIKIELTEF